MPDAISYLVEYLQRAHSDTYDIKSHEGWTHFIPVLARDLSPNQGWKIHISVDVPLFPATMALVGDWLCSNSILWKACRSLEAASALCSVPTPLSQVGKLITIYPRDDQHAEELATFLYERLKGIPGPVVPSDIRFRPDGPVYFRYGAFKGSYMYDLKTAAKVPYITRPDGQRVPDARKVGLPHPEWQPLLSVLATDHSSDLSQAESQGHAGLFGRNIEVLDALRQSAKGGVYFCQSEGRRVVLKEGRHGTTPGMTGTDTITRIKNEYACLSQLAATHVAPQPYDLFMAEGNIYLLMEFLEGRTLRAVVEALNYTGEENSDSIRTICQHLIRLVQIVHQNGIRIRDLTPNNIMVTGSECRLVDLELAFRLDGDESPFRGYTFGYIPVGQQASPRVAETYDYYSLGKVLLFILLGFDVVNLADLTSLRRLNKYPDLQDLFDLAYSWVSDFNDPTTTDLAISRPLDQRESQATVAQKLLNDATWDAEYLWPSPENSLFSPVCLYSGSTGVAWFCYQAYLAIRDPGLLHGAKQLVDWALSRHPFIPGETHSGLFFGHGAIPLLMGMIHAAAPELYDADAIMNQLLPLLVNGNGGYDVTHGLSGIGIAAALVASMTPQVSNELFDQLEAVALQVISDVQAQPEDLTNGFAHGLAGVGYFLTLLYSKTHWSRLADVVDSIARQLLANKIVASDGVFFWPKSSNDDKVWTHWCHGSSGIGTFFLSAGHIFSNDTFRDAGIRAAEGIARHHGFGSLSLCHGFPGDLDFILDVIRDYPSTELLDYKRHMLNKLECTLDIKHSSDKTFLWPRDGGTQIAPSFMTGYVGIHSMLLRARNPEVPRMCGVLVEEK